MSESGVSPASADFPARLEIVDLRDLLVKREIPVNAVRLDLVVSAGNPDPEVISALRAKRETLEKMVAQAPLTRRNRASRREGRPW